MRGRVMALFGMVFLGTTPIGAPLAGWAAEALGSRVALGLSGAICVVAAGVTGLALRRAGRIAARGPVMVAGEVPAEAAGVAGARSA
jgi:hypothetical protein